MQLTNGRNAMYAVGFYPEHLYPNPAAVGRVKPSMAWVLLLYYETMATVHHLILCMKNTTNAILQYESLSPFFSHAFSTNVPPRYKISVDHQSFCLLISLHLWMNERCGDVYN